MGRRIRVGIAATALALVVTTLGSAPPGAGAAPPGGSGQASAEPDSATAQRPIAPGGYTLITGDRVRVGTTPEGVTTASLLPGSPHHGAPVHVQQLGEHLYVVPQMPVEERRKLDTSVFDVGALSRSGGEVPLSVTFERGTAPRDLPGIDVDTAAAKRLRTGATVIRASYDATAPSAPSVLASLRGVMRIEGPESTIQRAPGDYTLRTLTIRVNDRSGRPVPYAAVTVMNTRDSRLLSAAGDAVDGEWRLSVPEGDYMVMAMIDGLVLVHEVSVRAATTESMSLAEATVKPSMRLRGPHEVLEPMLTLVRRSSHFGELSYAILGSLPRLNPQAYAALGQLFTFVGTTWVNQGFQPTKPGSHERLIVAKERARGIPRDLSYRFGRSDFTHNKIQSYSTGATETGFLGTFALAPGEPLGWTALYGYQRPSTVEAWYQRSRTLRWSTTVTAGEDYDAPELIDTRRIPRNAVVLPFFKGPLAPIQDRGLGRATTSRFCALCVQDGVLTGNLAALSTGSTTQYGTAPARWVLRRGKEVLARGQGRIRFDDVSVKAGQRLTLQTSTSVESWTLSDRSRGTFGFTIPRGDTAVPLSRSAWSVPMDLQGVVPDRTVTFPLSFDNLGPASNRIKRARVSYSTNGRTWRKASVVRTGARAFRVRYPNPPAGNRVSIRVSAVDARRQTSVERIDHVYTTAGRSRPLAGTPSSTASTGARALSAVSTVDSDSSSRSERRTVHRFDPNRLCRAPRARVSICYAELQGATPTTARAASGPRGLGATAIRDAYDIPAGGADTTVGVVVAYDYPTAERDLAVYRTQFGLPPCTTANGCFTKINQKGQAGNYPEPDQGWSVEAALDLQMVSAACPTCKIVLAEADQPTDAPLSEATDAAIAAGATVTNHSYGRLEFTGDTPGRYAAYDRPGVTAVSATGDYGYRPASVPASVPNVVAVGGTTLTRADNARGWRETTWADGGSGCSGYFAKPSWQTDPACGMRTIGDLSAVAKRLAVYNSYVPKPHKGWLVVGGTSAASPIVAGLIGAAGSGGMKPNALYGQQGSYFDIITGSNGRCRKNYMCQAKRGYDAPTGFGTPRGLTPFLRSTPATP